MAQKKWSQLPVETPTSGDKIPYLDVETMLNKIATLATFITAIFGNVPAATLAAALSAVAITRNLLANGNMNIWQRNTTFTPNDDTYIADRWNALVETNGAWTFDRDPDVPATGGSHYSLRATNVTLNNQCALVQILEAKNSIPLAGKTVSLSFYAKTGSLEIGNLRAAILSWSSTEDVVTSDVVSAWAQNGTNPTWAANWTMENTPSNLALTNDWQKFTIENVTLDTASLKNIAVVIWVDDGTIAAADRFYITQIQLNEGPEALPFQNNSFASELIECQRYYQTSYPYGSVPGTADGYQGHGAICFADTTTDVHGANPFRTKMRASPSITVYAFDGASGSGTAARIRDETAGGLETVTAIGPANNLAAGIMGITVNTGLTVGRAYGFNYVADAEL